jgi:homoprotocatechuate degradation regulator HpaR
MTDLPPTSQSLPIVLLRAREAVMAPIRHMLADSGVTEQQWRVLRVLAEHGPLDASTVAERASLLFPSLTRTATTMRDRGLVSQVQDQKDRRRQVLEITDKGRAVIADNLAEALRISQGYKARMGEEDYATLLRLLHMLAEDR